MLFKHILLSSIVVNNKVFVIENKLKNLQLQLSTFENFQLQLQQNRVINNNFVDYNYNFSKPAVNTNFYSLWFDPTGNRTPFYRFSPLQ